MLEQRCVQVELYTAPDKASDASDNAEGEASCNAERPSFSALPLARAPASPYASRVLPAVRQRVSSPTCADARECRCPLCARRRWACPAGHARRRPASEDARSEYPLCDHIVTQQPTPSGRRPDVENL